MRTAEGDEKAKIKNYLNAIGAYHIWPVHGGYGQPLVDCYACIAGCFVAIEVKAPGGRYTARQQFILKEVRAAGGYVACGDAAHVIAELEVIREEKIWRPLRP